MADRRCTSSPYSKPLRDLETIESVDWEVIESVDWDAIEPVYREAIESVYLSPTTFRYAS